MYYKRLMRFMPNERKEQLQKVIDTLRIGGRSEKTGKRGTDWTGDRRNSADGSQQDQIFSYADTGRRKYYERSDQRISDLGVLEGDGIIPLKLKNILNYSSMICISR